MTHAIATSEKLFEETAQLTGVTEYGVGWNDLTTGQADIPPQGARFDITFEGTLEGDRLAGTIKGVDYATVRADGCFDMNIFATITTRDGATIAFHEEGILTPGPDGVAQLRLNMRFNTAHPDYTWLNKLQGRGEGTADQKTGVVNVVAVVA